jgi:hypothetical protein
MNTIFTGILILVIITIYLMTFIEGFRGGGGHGGGGHGGFGGGYRGSFGNGFGGGYGGTYYDSGFPPYGAWYNPSLNNYANEVAYDLQNTFVPANNSGYQDAPWDPSTYREKMLPNGQIIGDIVPN